MHPWPRPLVRYHDGGSEYPKGAHRFLQEVDCVRCDAYVHILRARQDRGYVVKILIFLVQTCCAHQCCPSPCDNRWGTADARVHHVQIRVVTT